MTVVAFSRSLKKSDVWLQDRLRSLVPVVSSPFNLGLWKNVEKSNLGSVRGITAEGGLVERFRGGVERRLKGILLEK